MITTLLRTKPLWLLPSLIIALFSCRKLEQLLTFTISDQCSMTIPSTSPVSLPTEVSTPNVTTNSSQQFQKNNSNVNLVRDIRLNELQLTITNPTNKTFSFLQSVHIYISTNSSAEIELAYLDSIPATSTSIILVPTQSKLDSYVKASSYNLRTKTVTRETLTQNVDIQIHTKFQVTANL